MRAKCTAPVRKGDVLSLAYCARGVRTDSEIAEVTFLNAVQLDRAPWTKVFEERPVFPIPEGWIWHQSVHVSPETFKAGEYVFNIQFGGIDPQEFEIADLAFVNHGPDADPASLPRDTELRRRMADYLAKSGNVTGTGYGVFLFDGERVIK